MSTLNQAGFRCKVKDFSSPHRLNVNGNTPPLPLFRRIPMKQRRLDGKHPLYPVQTKHLQPASRRKTAEIAPLPQVLALK
jgi:hypothetical protein